MEIKVSSFLQTLFQIGSKTNLNIDNLPSLGALLYQAAELMPSKRLDRSHFIQIAQKFCGVLEHDGAILFDLYAALAGTPDAEPRLLVSFLFATLFKTTVSSRRQKILQSDLWPAQVQTFEAMLEQFVKTCSDLLVTSLCVTKVGKAELEDLKCDEAAQNALRFLFTFPEGFSCIGMPALTLSGQITQMAQCTVQGTDPVETTVKDSNSVQTVVLQNQTKRAVVYSFSTTGNVELTNCSQCVVYLLKPVKNITMSACKNLKLYAPCVTGVLSVQNSKNISVSSCARFMKIYHSDEISLCVSALTAIVQDSNFQTIQSAPFNLIYDPLLQELKQNALEPVLEEFKTPRILGPLGTDTGDLIQFATDFVTQIVPFGNHQNAQLQARLPDHFQRILDCRIERLQQFQKQMDSLRDDEKQNFENDVKAQLHLWIQNKNMQGEMGWLCEAEVKIV